MMSVFFGASPVRSLAEAKRTHHGHYPKFFWAMLERGVYLPPSPFESSFLSLAHGTKDLDATSSAFRAALHALK